MESEDGYQFDLACPQLDDESLSGQEFCSKAVQEREDQEVECSAVSCCPRNPDGKRKYVCGKGKSMKLLMVLRGTKKISKYTPILSMSPRNVQKIKRCLTNIPPVTISKTHKKIEMRREIWRAEMECVGQRIREVYRMEDKKRRCIKVLDPKDCPKPLPDHHHGRRSMAF